MLPAFTGDSRRYETEIGERLGERAEDLRIRANVDDRVDVIGRPHRKPTPLGAVQVDQLTPYQRPPRAEVLVEVEDALPRRGLLGWHRGKNGHLSPLR